MSTSTRGRDKFNKYKRILLILSLAFKVLPIKLRIKMLDFFRHTNGLIGISIRYALIKTIAKECGDNVAIQPGVYLLSPENLSLGNNVSIHSMCYIDSTGEIVIGNDVSIAHSTTIMSTSHNYDNRSIPIKDQGISRGRVSIENNVWVGARVVILSGTNIASGCILAAGTVVTKNTNKDFIYGGVPAKSIKRRWDR